MEPIQEVSREIRRTIYKIANAAGGGHLGGAFSMADIISVLYFDNVLRYDPGNPDWEGRDLFVLSKGHSCYALYAALLKAGFFSEKELGGIGKPGSVFGGHPKRGEIPGVEASTGALGHGLSFGIGNAFAYRADRKDNHVYVLLGDGECQEGSVWEGALSAPALTLDNLTVVIDYNKLQGIDRVDRIVPMDPFADKWEAFGWKAIEIDGHDHAGIKEALLFREEGKPVAVIAHTIKGKGVSFMENAPVWHYRMPNEKEIPVLLEELGMEAKDLAFMGGVG